MRGAPQQGQGANRFLTAGERSITLSLILIFTPSSEPGAGCQETKDKARKDKAPSHDHGQEKADYRENGTNGRQIRFHNYPT
jgi:hypothetical protein